MRNTPVRRRAFYTLVLCLCYLLLSVVALIWNHSSQARSLPATTDLSVPQEATSFDNTIIQLTKLDNQSSRNFGQAVAISGDTTAVVGRFYDGGGVSIYVRQGANWTLQQKLDAFGTSVALSGDTLVVGASVYVRSGGTWSLQQVLQANDAQQGDHFGSSVAISGDTIVVGSSETIFGTGTFKGTAAYVFKRQGTTWSQQQKLIGDTDTAGFGTSVAVSGETIVIGAPGARNSQGTAYIYEQRDGTWVRQQELLPDNSASANWFGYSVAISGETIVVGSAGAGAAYVFARQGDLWMLQQKLTASDGRKGYSFGFPVAISDDLIAVGTGDSFASATYVFARNGGTWSEQQIFFPRDGETINEDAYYWIYNHCAVAISGKSVVSGAFFNGYDGAPLGVAHVYDISTISPSPTTYNIVGRVTDQNGVGISGLKITITQGNETFISRRSGSDGKYVAGLWPAGTNLTITAPSFWLNSQLYSPSRASVTINNLSGPQVVDFVYTINHRPVVQADAIGSLIIAPSAIGAQVKLSGSATDEDGDALTFKWFDGTQQIATGAQAEVTLGAGYHGIYLMATDSRGVSARTQAQSVKVTISHEPVVQVAPIISPVVASSAAGAVVKLSSRATDPDGDALTFTWFDRSRVIARSAVAEVTLSVGYYQIYLVVTDSNGTSTVARWQDVVVTDTPTPAPTPTPVLTPAPYYNITGRVTDQNGKAIEGATLNLSGASGGRAVTDRTGYYTFRNLEAGGSYRVTPATASLRAGIKAYYPNPGWVALNSLSSNQMANFAYTLTSPWTPPDESQIPTPTPTPAPTPTPTPSSSADGELLNPSFESNGTSWTTSGTVEYARGNFVTDGKLAAKLSPASAFSGASVLQRVALTAGATYEISADITTSGRAQATLGVKWDNGSDGPAAGSNTRRTTVRFTVPQGVSQVGIYCKVTGALSKDNWATVDNFKLVRVN